MIWTIFKFWLLGNMFILAASLWPVRRSRSRLSRIQKESFDHVE